MRRDGFDDFLPVVAMQFVAAALDPHQPGAGNRAGKRLAVLDREDRIGGAMDDEQRQTQVLYPSLRTAALEQEVVGGAAEIAGTVVIFLDHRACPFAVERMQGAGNCASV